MAVSCTWLILYLPITGALCCLAGGGAVLLSGYLPLGAVLIAHWPCWWPGCNTAERALLSWQ